MALSLAVNPRGVQLTKVYVEVYWGISGAKLAALERIALVNKPLNKPWSDDVTPGLSLD